MERECACCGRHFTARNSTHKYCSEVNCQRMRKKRWQKCKLATDPSYKGNQADARRRWQEKHPDYWRTYRKRHPQYEAHNRQQQRLRNERQRGRATVEVSLESASVIAKMDARPAVKSGTYRLIPVGVPMIANMDMVVELSLISTPYSDH